MGRLCANHSTYAKGLLAVVQIYAGYITIEERIG